jgi:multimeric flavodoxin WrbA
MNVVAFNGSPRKNGNTAQLLQIVLGELRAAGAETELVDLCPGRPRGCTACMKCFERKDGRCAVADDPMNDWIAKMAAADGILIGSPTYFANVSAETKALIDRSGLVARANDGLFRRKAGAAVIAVRRGGAVPAFDAINHMFQINEMIVVGSLYWNFAIGRAPGEVQGDEEGVRTMKNLGQNMAWLLQKIGR